MAAERTAAVTISFKPKQLEELRELAEAENRSLSRQIQHLIGVGMAAEYDEPAAAE
jgi:hypothetical protein